MINKIRDDENVTGIDDVIEISRCAVRCYLSKNYDKRCKSEDYYQESAFCAINAFSNGETLKGKIFIRSYYGIVEYETKSDRWNVWNKSFSSFEIKTKDDEMNAIDLYLIDNTDEDAKTAVDNAVETLTFFDKVISEHFAENSQKDGLYLYVHGLEKEKVCEKLGYNLGTFKVTVQTFNNFVKRLYPKYVLSQN